MKRLYDDNLYQFDTPQPSYWEATGSDLGVKARTLRGSHSCDVAVIGGGYTGLSAALHLARDYDVDVRVLEAGHFGWGASGRNGGFCCVGGTGVSRSDTVRMWGIESARDYYRSQVEAVELVRQIAEEEGIDYQACGAAEVEVAHTARAFDRLKDDHVLLSSTLGMNSQIVVADEFSERYYDSPQQFGALITRPAFAIHPLRYCRGLSLAAVARGAVLHDRSEVLEWRKTDSGAHHLVTADGSLQARRVVFATNGFMPEALNAAFHARTLPVVSAIVVTRPLTDAEKAAQNWRNPHPTINSRRILNYYRLLPDDRFLFGGRGHTKGHKDGERRTYGEIEAAMHRMLPAWANVEIDYRWHGLICFTRSLTPSVGRLDDDSNVYFGFGYHGNGVNTATWTGKQIADWIGRGKAPQLPEIVKGLGKRFRPAGLRLKFLQAGIGLSAWLDRRS